MNIFVKGRVFKNSQGREIFIYIFQNSELVRKMRNYLPGGYSTEDSDHSDSDMMMVTPRDSAAKTAALPNKGGV